MVPPLSPGPPHRREPRGAGCGPRAATRGPARCPRSAARARAGAASAPAAGTRGAARPRRLWPYFALGGAAVGFGTVVALAVTQCDPGCRDDGGVGFGIILGGPVGAGIGALGGTAVGLVADARRRR